MGADSVGGGSREQSPVGKFARRPESFHVELRQSSNPPPRMKMRSLLRETAAICVAALSLASASAEVGHTYPSEKKVVMDPVTGTELTFLTSTPVGDSKIYQTHPDWTSDGKWLIFRSRLACRARRSP